MKERERELRDLQLVVDMDEIHHLLTNTSQDLPDRPNNVVIWLNCCHSFQYYVLYMIKGTGYRNQWIRVL